ncbi:MAG: hypothetical protein L3J46_05340, partial [Kangiellaceae bacterium]|nr:hypothetical protein [Kangiellaceae bacterium]
KYRAAAVWSCIGAFCAAIGLTHAYQVSGNAIDFLFIFAKPSEDAYAYRAWPIAVGYLLAAAAIVACIRTQSEPKH